MSSIYSVYTKIISCEKIKEVTPLERIPKLIKFPADLVKKIEEYQEQNHLSSFAAAVYELIRKGLKHS